jgi:hypothetical protein
VPSTGLLALLSPRLLLVTAALLRRTLSPATALRRLVPLPGLSPATALCRLLPLAWLTLTLAALARLTLALAGPRAPWLTLARLTVLSRLARQRAYRLLPPTGAALLRRLPLVRSLRMLLRLLRALAPTATLAGRLLTPAALTPLSPLLPALAPRLPRTPRSLRRRRHICSF